MKRDDLPHIVVHSGVATEATTAIQYRFEQFKFSYILDVAEQASIASVMVLAKLGGQWLHQLKPLTLKKHGRRAKSIFRYGFDHLRNMVFNLEQKMEEFWFVLQFLSCT
jgi:hypothetical protein